MCLSRPRYICMQVLQTETTIFNRTRCCPSISGIGFTNQKIPVLYKFRPLKVKLSVNLGPSGKSLVHLYLYYFYSCIFTFTVLCTTLYVLYCIVVLVTVFCALYGYSATLAAMLINKPLDLTSWTLSKFTCFSQHQQSFKETFFSLSSNRQHFNFLCVYFCGGVTLVAFLCPMYTVDYIYVFLT